jgi:hypothetical protein
MGIAGGWGVCSVFCITPKDFLGKIPPMLTFLLTASARISIISVYFKYLLRLFILFIE